MPTYLYRFNDTDEVVEVEQSIFDDTLTEIDGRPVRKIYRHTPGIILRGSDFYRNNVR